MEATDLELGPVRSARGRAVSLRTQGRCLTGALAQRNPRFLLGECQLPGLHPERGDAGSVCCLQLSSLRAPGPPIAPAPRGKQGHTDHGPRPSLRTVGRTRVPPLKDLPEAPVLVPAPLPLQKSLGQPGHPAGRRVEKDAPLSDGAAPRPLVPRLSDSHESCRPTREIIHRHTRGLPGPGSAQALSLFNPHTNPKL